MLSELFLFYFMRTEVFILLITINILCNIRIKIKLASHCYDIIYIFLLI